MRIGRLILAARAYSKRPRTIIWRWDLLEHVVEEHCTAGIRYLS